MNLLTATAGVGIGVLGITIATGFMDLQSTTTALAGTLGLAVGIDCALFIINRHRQELRRGTDVPTTIGIAVGTSGSAVVTAGTTVTIAQARADQLLTDGFGPGFNWPLIVLFEGDNAVQAATDAAGPIDALGDVAVVTPAIPTGTAPRPWSPSSRGPAPPAKSPSIW